MERVTQPFLHYCFDNLLPYKSTIKHSVFTRVGGISSAPFDSLNIRYGIEDDSSAVNHNRSQIQHLLDINPEQLISANQTHSTNICVIHREDDGIPKQYQLDQNNEVNNVDAFISNKPELYFMIQVADCQPIVIFDPISHVIANIHSGWRGSLANIAGKTVATMEREFGTNPEHCIVGVGPSLGPCCAAYPNEESQFKGALKKFYLPNKHADFWEMTKHQLIKAGVKAKNIEVATVCTACHTEEFFSYRAAKSQPTGRFGVVIGLID